MSRKDFAAERSAIMGIFTETQEKLEAQNKEIISEQDKIDEELLELHKRYREIDIVAKQNKTTLSKIKKIIGL